MSYVYDFYLEDITSETTLEEIQEALLHLPGIQYVGVEHMTEREVKIKLYLNEDLLPWFIEDTLQMNIESTQPRVRWEIEELLAQHEGAAFLDEEIPAQNVENIPTQEVIDDTNYQYTPPTMGEALAWTKLLGRIQRGELIP